MAAPKVMTPVDFQQRLQVSHETLARLERYAALLIKWNRAINLVGRRSLDDLWRRHFWDSAQLLAPLRERGPAEKTEPVILDLGSGAGFPGMVLAILGAGKVHLVEADRKKAAFLREVSRETGAPVTVHTCRIEALKPFPVDVVTARALAPLPRLLDYAMPFLDQVTGGRRPLGLFLKGASVAQELTDAQKKWKIVVDLRPSETDPEGAVLSLRLPPVGEDDR